MNENVLLLPLRPKLPLPQTGENLSSMLTDLGNGGPEVPCGNRPALKQLVDLAAADPTPTAPKAKAKGEGQG